MQKYSPDGTKQWTVAIDSDNKTYGYVTVDKDFVVYVAKGKAIYKIEQKAQ